MEFSITFCTFSVCVIKLLLLLMDCIDCVSFKSCKILPQRKKQVKIEKHKNVLHLADNFTFFFFF